jgi:ribosomal protein L11 methyltransferase
VFGAYLCLGFQEDKTLNRQWWELRVFGDPALDEFLSWELQSLGCQGTASQVKDGQLKIAGYLSAGQYTEANLEQMAQGLKQSVAEMALATGAIADINWSLIQEEDWANSWKDYWHPTPVGNRLLIQPDWLPLSSTDRLVLRLNPGVAFGTGAHATTQLCLTALETLLTPPIPHPYTIADIGCGTGILAIAALQLGADRAYAVDTDPLAVQSAQECRDLNNIGADRMSVSEGSIQEVIRQLDAPVEGFCCNILAHTIIDFIIPHLLQLTQPEGWGLLSGILYKQIPIVAEALETHGWSIYQTWQQEDWVCLKIQRSDFADGFEEV